MIYLSGGTIGRGLNRAFATLLGGAIGVGVDRLAAMSGDIGQPILLGLFVMVLSTYILSSRQVVLLCNRNKL